MRFFAEVSLSQYSKNFFTAMEKANKLRFFSPFLIGFAVQNLGNYEVLCRDGGERLNAYTILQYDWKILRPVARPLIIIVYNCVYYSFTQGICSAYPGLPLSENLL